MTDRKVQGYCPMGCGETLFVGAGGHITCSYIPCPNPVAVDILLQTDQPNHLVQINPDDFSMTHPLRERIGGELHNCRLNVALMDGTIRGPRETGRYVVTELPSGSFMWEAVS